ncbi:MAG TPA: tetratricopeptide repeat protein, partial [Coriobacteriia bacterium]|nr:tetratricopeptide repeat protein [Coriobacteriia bacterium]
AVRAYDAALEDPEYLGQHRALRGKAGALYEMGRIEDAAMAYRQAALDGDNPDPGKALNNLGMCFMAMDRPTDAVEAYRAALGFDSYTGRGRALANLGMAYHVIERHGDAVKAFEKATELHSHQLTDVARVAYATSRSHLAPDTEREVVEGWTTGEMTRVSAGDESAGGAPPPPEPSPSADTSLPQSEDDGVENFFALTDAEMLERDREARRAERRLRRADRHPLTVVAAVLLVVSIVGGAGVALFMWGVGYPTQQMTVSGMMQARSAGDPVAQHWVAVPTADIDKEMAKIPPMTGFVIESVERSPRTSVAIVTVTPESGAPLSYRVSLAREGVGWKVTGVDNHWNSTESGDPPQETP